MKKLIGPSIALFLFSALPVPSLNAATFYILPDSSGDAPTIQAGLDMCAEGDTVLVASGTYTENIVWPLIDGLVLMSESGPEDTIIDGGGIERVIACFEVDSLTVIEGFTIQHGYSYRGAGIGVEYSALTIKNNIIRENVVYDHPDWVDGGAGIGCLQSTAKIIDNLITHNSCSATGVNGGGGIGINAHSGPVVVTGNTITDNYAMSGAGIIVTNASTPIISNNIIANNDAWRGGGGITTKSEAAANVFDNEISGNTGAEAGGGIRSVVGDMSIFTRNTVSGNTAPQGAGIYCNEGSQALITQCQIVSNNGDGVTCSSYVTPVVNYNNIMDNSGYGLCNLYPTIIIDATMNYWGDASGPYHPTANPSGSGDEVSDYVDFEPWSTDIITGVVQHGLSERYGDLAAYPNPFNPQTTVTFSLPRSSWVDVSVFDLSGRLIDALASKEFDAGSHALIWDGRDRIGRFVPSATYLVRLETGERAEAKKVMLVR